VKEAGGRFLVAKDPREVERELDKIDELTACGTCGANLWGGR
jgi:hypothetical protein